MRKNSGATVYVIQHFLTALDFCQTVPNEFSQPIIIDAIFSLTNTFFSSLCGRKKAVIKNKSLQNSSGDSVTENVNSNLRVVEPCGCHGGQKDAFFGAAAAIRQKTEPVSIKLANAFLPCVFIFPAE